MTLYSSTGKEQSVEFLVDKPRSVALMKPEIEWQSELKLMTVSTSRTIMITLQCTKPQFQSWFHLQHSQVVCLGLDGEYWKATCERKWDRRPKKVGMAIFFGKQWTNFFYLLVECFSTWRKLLNLESMGESMPLVCASRKVGDKGPSWYICFIEVPIPWKIPKV